MAPPVPLDDFQKNLNDNDDEPEGGDELLLKGTSAFCRIMLHPACCRSFLLFLFFAFGNEHL